MLPCELAILFYQRVTTTECQLHLHLLHHHFFTNPIDPLLLLELKFRLLFLVDHNAQFHLFFFLLVTVVVGIILERHGLLENKGTTRRDVSVENLFMNQDAPPVDEIGGHLEFLFSDGASLVKTADVHLPGRHELGYLHGHDRLAVESG